MPDCRKGGKSRLNYDTCTINKEIDICNGHIYDLHGLLICEHEKWRLDMSLINLNSVEILEHPRPSF